MKIYLSLLIFVSSLFNAYSQTDSTQENQTPNIVDTSQIKIKELPTPIGGDSGLLLVDSLVKDINKPSDSSLAKPDSSSIARLADSVKIYDERMSSQEKKEKKGFFTKMKDRVKREQASIGGNFTHVFDYANLYNPTLRDKFEQKLSDSQKKTHLKVRILTLPFSMIDKVDETKRSLLWDENDILIFVLPRIDTVRGQFHIFTMNEADEFLPYDTCRAITKHVKETSLDDDKFEAGTIYAVDTIIDILENQIEPDRNPTTTTIIIIGIVILAIALYKFSTSSFRDTKKKLSKKYRAERSNKIKEENNP